MVTPQNALKLSMWLAANHPRAFKAVLDRVHPRDSARVYAGLGGGVTYIPGNRKFRMPPTHVRGSFGGAAHGNVGGFGDDLPEVTVTAPDVSADVPISVDPVLQDINVDVSATDTPNFDLSAAAAASDTSGGFWGSIGSGLSSIGSGLASAVGSVAGAIVNPQTLAAAGNLAATVIKANGANAQQQALLQAQFARTAGAGPHPVTYGTDPRTGQTVPMVYNPSTGQYQPQTTLAGLFSGGNAATQWLPYILIGGGILLVAAVVLRK